MTSDAWPGSLTLGELARVGFDQVDRRRQIAFSGEIGQDFAIAETLSGRSAQSAGSLGGAANFVD